MSAITATNQNETESERTSGPMVPQEHLSEQRHILFNPSSCSCSYSLLRLSSLGPRLRLPPNPRSVSPFSTFLYSSANWIFITPIPFRYTTKRYIIKRNNNVLTLLSMHSGYVPGENGSSPIYWIILIRDYFLSRMSGTTSPILSVRYGANHRHYLPYFSPSRVCCLRG